MAIDRNPKDNMASTWRQDRSKWTFHHRVLYLLDSLHDDNGDAFPVFQKTDPLPKFSAWSTHVWILYHALWPMGLQALYWHFTGKNIHPVSALVLYTLAFQINAIHEVWSLRKVAKITGFFDGDKHPRDKIPDVGVDKVMSSTQLTVITRTVFTVLLSYRSNKPVSLSPWLPVELFLYSVVLDFWFYIYHRSCHEVSNLWKYHRTHHLTKHPVPLMSAYADSEQEILEIAIIPLMTYASLRLLGMPMGFYDWWIVHQYVLFSEAFGHSGLRMYASTPGVSSHILQLFDCQLLVEDHDLHHRHGWRTSCNYGKQTRLWDRLFGTCGKRIESGELNVRGTVNMPLY